MNIQGRANQTWFPVPNSPAPSFPTVLNHSRGNPTVLARRRNYNSGHNQIVHLVLTGHFLQSPLKIPSNSSLPSGQGWINNKEGTHRHEARSQDSRVVWKMSLLTPRSCQPSWNSPHPCRYIPSPVCALAQTLQS